jgi:hypothetical protein
VSGPCRVTPTLMSTRHPSIIPDYSGQPWRVAEARPTVHGWALYLGRPVREDGTCVRQGATAIPTPELRDHLAATVPRPSETDLPLSPPAVRRLSHMLGLTWRAHRRQWWEEREGDLERMTEDRFARRHGVSQSGVSRQLKKQGRLRRHLQALDDVGLRQLLALKIPHTELARILDVAPSTVARWRSLVSAEQPPMPSAGGA